MQSLEVLLSRLGKCLEHIDKRAGLCTVKEQAANMSYLEPTMGKL